MSNSLAAILTIARLTLREALRRKVLWVLVGLTLVIGGSDFKGQPEWWR